MLFILENDYVEPKRVDPFQRHAENNSKDNSPSTLFASSDKKKSPEPMPTITEDIYESQTTSLRKNNNEDLRDVTDLKTKRNLMTEYSDNSNTKDISKSTQNTTNNLSSRQSKTKHRKKTPIKMIDPFNMKSSKSRKPMRRDYSKLIENLQSSCPEKKICQKNAQNNHKHKLSIGSSISVKSNSQRKPSKTVTTRPTTALNKTSQRFLLSSFDTAKGIQYNGDNCQSKYVKNVNQRKKSYHSLLKKYKKRHNSINPAFKPTINPHSKWLLDEKSYKSLERVLKNHNGTGNYSSFSCRNHNKISFNDNSVQKDRLVDRSKDEYILMKQNLIKDEYTFKPRINKHSEQLASSKRSKSASSVSQGKSSKNNNEDIHDRLYNESLEQSKRKLAMTYKFISTSK